MSRAPRKKTVFPVMTPAQYNVVSVLEEKGCVGTREICDTLKVPPTALCSGLRRTATIIGVCVRNKFVVPLGDGTWSITIHGHRTFMFNHELLKQRELDLQNI